jgi:hypothetical protein
LVDEEVRSFVETMPNVTHKDLPDSYASATALNQRNLQYAFYVWPNIIRKHPELGKTLHYRRFFLNRNRALFPLFRGADRKTIHSQRFSSFSNALPNIQIERDF